MASAKKDAVSIVNAEARVYKKILFESKADFVRPIQQFWKYMFQAFRYIYWLIVNLQTQ
jgi:hypothetical protein